VLPEMFTKFDRVVGRHTGTVCDKIAVVRPNWLEPFSPFSSLTLVPHGTISENASTVPTGTRLADCHRAFGHNPLR
jgi:hypothetical protein